MCMFPFPGRTENDSIPQSTTNEWNFWLIFFRSNLVVCLNNFMFEWANGRGVIVSPWPLVMCNLYSPCPLLACTGSEHLTAKD